MDTTPRYMSREQLSSMLLDAKVDQSLLAIIDVRDDDHIGGHILGSVHIPSSTLDYKIPQLVRTLKEKKKVVFHCALSQQRGPAAARRYVQQRNTQVKQEQDAEKPAIQSDHDVSVDGPKAHVQEVYILDGGFVKWQEIYGTNKKLTDAYAEDVWNSY